MKLDGSLNDFGLEAIFQLINSERLTGTLHISRKTGDAEGFVYFRAGKIFGAVSNFNRQPIGERLVGAGYITKSQLHEALEVQREGEKRRKLGQILISEGLITKEILQTFVKEQIQNTVFDLLPWTDGDFKFLQDKLPASEDMGLLLSARKILSKGDQRLDEWERLNARVPSLEAVFKVIDGVAEKAQAAALGPMHMQVTNSIDGQINVTDLAKVLSMSEFETCSYIFDLAEAGYIELVDVGFTKVAGDEQLSPDGRKIDAFDAFEELELSPEDVISDRANYADELVALTDGARKGYKRQVFMSSATDAVLAERVHLDREEIDMKEMEKLIAYVKGI